jgi:L-amino acid N-acyltransferase YncA
VVVREGRSEDADALAAIHGRAWRLGYEDVLPFEALEGWDRDEVRARLQRLLAGDGGRSVLVAETAAGVPHGFVAFGPARDEERAGEGEIVLLYVEPAGQLAGLGSALHDAALDRLRQRGVAHAVVWVFEANAQGLEFYAHRGWVPDGGPHMQDDWSAPGVRLRRSLAS